MRLTCSEMCHTDTYCAYHAYSPEILAILSFFKVLEIEGRKKDAVLLFLYPKSCDKIRRKWTDTNLGGNTERTAVNGELKDFEEIQ